MGRHEKKKYLETIRQRYRNAKKAKKTIILSEFCETCGYNRKYAIRKLNSRPWRSFFYNVKASLSVKVTDNIIDKKSKNKNLSHLRINLKL